jgi:cell division protease FtsH
LGLTQQLPLEDRYLISKPFAEGQLKILMAGRAGEEIKFKEFSSGSQEDIKVATNLAEKMICRWGMSDSLGPVSLGKEYEDIFLGRQIVQSRGYSEETARKIDAETKKMIGESLEKAKQMLEENYLKFEALAKALLERETLEGEEIDSILRKSEQN